MIERSWMRWPNSSSDNRKSKTCTELSRSIQNRKLVGIVALVITFAMCVVEVRAQQPKKVPRIGYLSNTNPTVESARAEAIRLALRELGYTEGRNITIEYRYADGKPNRYPDLVAELVRLKVDIIVAAGGDALVVAAKNATKTIPIVMTGTGLDPVEAGLIETLARPGGNVTGITNISTGGLVGKRLELLKETVPELTRLAVLYDPTIPGPAREAKVDIPVAALALRLTVQPWEVRSMDDFDKVFAAIGKQRQDGLYVSGGPLNRDNRKRIAGFALKSRLPSVYQGREHVDAGGLMYYGADLADSYRRITWYVDKILKGAKPADLPVEQPTKFELVINQKTAKQIGLVIPLSVLGRADKVIK